MDVANANECLVCGGPILKRSRHFGVDGVCQACALFFGRYAKKELSCTNAENCKLFTVRHQLKSSVARKACKSCRFAKCLEMGMRADHMASAKQQLAAPNEPPPAQLNVDALLKWLANAESSVQILYGKARIFKQSLPPQFNSLRELFAWNANLVEETCKISELSHESAHSILATVAKEGNFSSKSELILVNMIAAAHSFKAMPFFHKLDVNDQISLFNCIGAPMFELSSKFYSVSQNSQVVVHKHPSGCSPFWAYQTPFYRDHQAVQRLSTSVFRTAVEVFNRVKLDEAEFLLLKMIISAHPAASGLSSRAIELLQSEKELYANVLMRLSRQRFGELGGVRRYAEVLHLAESVFHSAQRVRELNVYLAMVTDQHRFHAKFPRAFHNVVLHGEGSE